MPNGFEGKYYICPKYKWGRLVNQNEIYHIKVKRYFTREFGDLPLYEQKKIVSTDFLYYMQYVTDKLQKKKIDYNSNLLKNDLEKILTHWINS